MVTRVQNKPAIKNTSPNLKTVIDMLFIKKFYKQIKLTNQLKTLLTT